MMLKTLMTSLALTAALGTALPAYAQVTDQTDQSEEDWRKSRKKSGTSDIYRTPNTSSTGVGAPVIDYEPVSPVERLPSESRRHLMKERAKAIAESDDGDISDAEYVPSDEAKSDEQLMRDEQEAWDVIVTDMQESGGEATSEGGPNKVAVVGENGATPTRGSRGGSTRTLQEIMDAIKSGQTGGGNASGAANGQSPDGQPQGQNPSESVADASGQAQNDGDANAEGSSDNDGQAQEAGQDTGQGDASDQGDSSGEDNSTDTGDADAWPADTRAEEPLSPLERIRRAKEDSPTRGTQRSASDYLSTGHEKTGDD
ncbi:hypothetical protein GCM10009069_16230 [Algimonas arctica]|uniref:Uncharacterized protein n=1 Tax=Algimonas arctica TaxID=1479486 RepID=A0A8J3CSF4_9PROT|nr:hypothetical protein [Algimonas arctica]GHA93886.1 hypothetical protein GCM10009069_16230 [Algimonas arctica]